MPSGDRFFWPTLAMAWRASSIPLVPQARHWPIAKAEGDVSKVGKGFEAEPRIQDLDRSTKPASKEGNRPVPE
jgi:hypothetical protein